MPDRPCKAFMPGPQPPGVLGAGEAWNFVELSATSQFECGNSGRSGIEAADG